MSSPTVSIIIPAYNARQFICRAIDSCLAQTYTDYDVIVVDDGSTDGTSDLVRERYGDRVQLIRKENGGVATARNVGIAATDSIYIKPLDSDDALHPTYLERVIERFNEEDETVALMYTRYYFIEGDTREAISQPILEGDLYCHLIDTIEINGMIPSTVMLRRQHLLDVGKFPEEPELQYIEDWDTWVRLAEKYQFVGIQDCLVDYHWHGGNMSNRTTKTSRALLQSYLQLRNHSRWRDCMTDDQMDDKLAGVYHKVAMKQWIDGDRSQARHYLREAMTLSPRSRIIRRVFYILSYVAPFSVVALTNAFLYRIRQLVKS